jgi:hypothetical protein
MSILKTKFIMVFQYTKGIAYDSIIGSYHTPDDAGEDSANVLLVGL